MTASEAVQRGDEPVRMCTFAVGSLLLGLPVEDVSEVVRGGVVTVVPLAPPAVTGLLNLRGRIVPVVDARLRFGLDPRGPDEEPTHVIVRTPGEHISLAVDSASDVVAVSPVEREDVPETVSPEIRRLLTSSYQRSGALLLILDPVLVLTDL